MGNGDARGLAARELRALRAEDVDLLHGVIRVERGWDPREGEIKLKSNAGRRKVPISAILRGFLTSILPPRGERDRIGSLGQPRPVPSTGRS
jgi:integrase